MNNGTEDFLRHVVVQGRDRRYINRYTGVPLDPKEVDLMLRETGLSRDDIRQVML